MQSRLKENFCNQFLVNQDKLHSLVELSIGEQVDKLMIVTFFLDDDTDEVFECGFLCNGELKFATMKVKKTKEDL